MENCTWAGVTRDCRREERRGRTGDEEIDVGGVTDVSVEGVSDGIGLNKQRERVKNLPSDWTM